MKKATLIITWVVLNLGSFPGKTQAQERYSRDHLVAGLSYCAAQGDVILNKNAVGLELGGFRQKTKNYAFGISADFIFSSTKSHPVHIPNNLMTNESLDPEFVVVALTTVHRVDLNPESKVKFFMEGKAGFRLASYFVTHYGYLLLIKSEDRIYSDTSFGLCLGLSTGIYIPLTADLRYGLRLKTGLHTGTSVNYVDIYYYDDDTFEFSQQKKSNATYWINAIDLVWRFR
jgi:hypothetical protein